MSFSLYGGKSKIRIGSFLDDPQSRMPRVCIGKNPGWFALAPRKGGSIPRFPDEPVGKEDVEVRSEGAQRC